MQFDEQQFAARVAAALDERELPAHITSRLMGARARALAAASWVSPNGRDALALSRQSLAGAVGASVLLLAASLWYASTVSESEKEFDEIDTAMLAGDLPVQAYLDPGFAAYLHRSLSAD